MTDVPPDGFYAGPQASDFTNSEDPFALFADWFGDARRHEINDPDAMSLATVDARGAPNARMVLLKGFDESGFVFYTNSGSAKGRELAGEPRAALCFHWKSLRRQVRARGATTPINSGEADAYFATRSRGSRIGAWASRQSEPLDARDDLARAVDAMTERFRDAEAPRPDYWNGYRLAPLEIEFWHDRPYRLHERVQFTRENLNAPWTRRLLYP
jgi:pyridoxamine 5'-phosphate oxidase